MTGPMGKVAEAFAAFPDGVRDGCLRLRQLIHDIATETPEVGPLTEALRWGQPAYLTEQPQSGTTIRIGCPKAGGYGLFVHCQTSLIRDFQPLAPDLRYDGNRGVLFAAGEMPDHPALPILIKNALTYHR